MPNHLVLNLPDIMFEGYFSVFGIVPGVNSFEFAFFCLLPFAFCLNPFSLSA